MSTIQERIENGERIMAHCQNPVCYSPGRELDLHALRDKLGPDHGAMHDNLVPLLRCSLCGSKNVGITIHVDNTRKPDLKSPYAKAKGG